MPPEAHPEFSLQLPSQFNIAEEFVSRPAREHPQRVAILGEPRAVSYGELAEEVNRVSGALLHSGVVPGDRVLIALPDSAEFIAVFFGAARIGAVAVPVNPLSRAPGFGHCLENSGAKIAIVHAASLPEFVSGLSSGAVTQIVILGEFSDGSNRRYLAARRRSRGTIGCSLPRLTKFHCIRRRHRIQHFFSTHLEAAGSPKAPCTGIRT